MTDTGARAALESLREWCMEGDGNEPWRGDTYAEIDRRLAALPEPAAPAPVVSDELKWLTELREFCYPETPLAKFADPSDIWMKVCERRDALSLAAAEEPEPSG